MIDSELSRNILVENSTTLAILLAFFIVYLIRKSASEHIGIYITTKYLSMFLLIIISSWYFIQTGININSELDPKENFQLVVVFVASLSTFLITLDLEYTKNFNDLRDIILDSKVYVPFSQKIGDSKFQFKNMVHAATISIFIVGPNLAFLSKKENKEGMSKLLFDKFRANSKFEIKMLIMDPRKKDKLDIKSLGFNDQFWDELEESVRTFQKWAKDAENDNYMFDIRVTDVLTLSLLFRDKSAPEGCVLVTPIPNGSQGANRACFLIKKKSYDMAFYEYYDAYNKLFSESESIKKIKL